MIPSSKFQHKPRLIAQYLQILAIDGFLSFGSLVSVWAYMWLMLESASFCKGPALDFGTDFTKPPQTMVAFWEREQKIASFQRNLGR